MRGKRKDLPASYEGMEKRFLSAIERLKEGKPLCPELQKKAKAGKLRVDVSAVALEAGSPDEKGVWRGLSRTLIGHDNCRYPKARGSARKCSVPAAATHVALALIHAGSATQLPLPPQSRPQTVLDAASLATKFAQSEATRVNSTISTVRLFGQEFLEKQDVVQLVGSGITVEVA